MNKVRKFATKFSYLILSKIVKIGQILRRKCTKLQIRFRLGLRPRPRWRSLQRSPRPHSWILGALHFLREGRREGNGMKKKGGEGRERRGEEWREGRGPPRVFGWHPHVPTPENTLGADLPRNLPKRQCSTAAVMLTRPTASRPRSRSRPHTSVIKSRSYIWIRRHKIKWCTRMQL